MLDVNLGGIKLEYTANHTPSCLVVARQLNKFSPTTKKQVVREIKEQLFTLRTVSIKEMEDIQRHEIPTFILKMGNTYYATPIPRNINFLSHLFLGAHKCAESGKECARLSASCDPQGCSKVRVQTKKIWEHDQIEEGYQTLNTHRDVFVVTKCGNYVMLPTRPKISPEEARNIRKGLDSFRDIFSEENLFEKSFPHIEFGL